MRNRGRLLALVWAIPLLLLASPAELLMLASAVLLHEGGHLFGFYATGEPCPRLAAVPMGLSLLPRRPLPYRHELLIAAAGPLANLLAALLLFSLRSSVALLPGIVHAMTAAANLIPLGQNDGARALFSLLAILFPLKAAEGAAHIIGAVSFFLLLFSMLFLLLHQGGGGILLLLITLLLRATRPA